MIYDHIGLHTARYSAIVLDDNSDILMPLGPNIVVWGLEEGGGGMREKGDIRYHDNIVMCVERNDRWIISTAYNSQAVVIHPKTREKVGEAKGIGSKVRVATVNREYYASCAEVCLDNISQTCVNIWKIGESGQLVHYHTMRGNAHCPVLFANNKMMYVNIVEIFDKQKEGVAESKIYNYTLCLFDVCGKQTEVEVSLQNNISEIVNYEVNEARDLVAITFLDKSILLVDDSGSIVGSLIVNVKGFVTSSVFRKGCLYFGLEPGQLMKIDVDKIKNEMRGAKVEVQFGQNDDIVTSILLEGNTCIRKTSFFLVWIDDSRILSGDEEGIYITDTQYQQVSNIKSDINVTACGVAVNSAGSLVAVGDFGGNVNVYLYDDSSMKSHKYLQTNIGVGVVDVGTREECGLPDRRDSHSRLDRRVCVRGGTARLRGRGAEAGGGRGQHHVCAIVRRRQAHVVEHYIGVRVLLRDAGRYYCTDELQALHAQARRKLGEVRLSAYALLTQTSGQRSGPVKSTLSTPG